MYKYFLKLSIFVIWDDIWIFIGIFLRYVGMFEIVDMMYVVSRNMCCMLKYMFIFIDSVRFNIISDGVYNYICKYVFLSVDIDFFFLK